MTFNHVGFGLGQRPLPVLEQYTAPDGIRFYNTPSGQRYPSVTTVLAEKGRQAIQQWRNRVGPETANTISRVAAGRGTSLHNAAEHYLKNQPVKLDSPLIHEMFGNPDHHLQHINTVHVQETRLFTHQLRLVGIED